MTVKDLLEPIDNGSVKLDIYNTETGELCFHGIWQNHIKPEVLDLVVSKISVQDYYMKIEAYEC